MHIVEADNAFLERLLQDPRLVVRSYEEYETRYDEVTLAFHEHFDSQPQAAALANAFYHKKRYLAICREPLCGRVLDVGNDKPFLSFYLKMLYPDAEISTISFDIPQTPYKLYAVDIEKEVIPFATATFDYVLFSEVLEHLWRDPAFAVHQINRVLQPGGKLYLTTPNACELHAITCVLWQSNPNGRNQFYSNLESGHLHLWTTGELRLLAESNGFVVDELTSFNPYGYTDLNNSVADFARRISPHFDLMGESLLMRASKRKLHPRPVYEPRLFPEGKGVQFHGAIRSFVSDIPDVEKSH